jgi:transposase
MARICIAPHLDTEELRRRYRDCRDGTLKVRYQLVWLLAEGRPAKEVAETVGFSAEWVRDLARRYNQLGPDGLRDGRKRPGAGRERLLTPEDEQELDAWIAAGGPEDGPLNSVTVAVWMSRKLGRPVHYQVAWRYLRRLGYSPQRPRPRHAAADQEAQEAFKKGASGKP